MRRQINTADEPPAFVPCVAPDGRPKPEDVIASRLYPKKVKYAVAAA